MLSTALGVDISSKYALSVTVTVPLDAVKLLLSLSECHLFDANMKSSDVIICDGKLSVSSWLHWCGDHGMDASHEDVVS